jgi:hypothetical protein
MQKLLKAVEVSTTLGLVHEIEIPIKQIDQRLQQANES